MHLGVRVLEGKVWITYHAFDKGAGVCNLIPTRLLDAWKVNHSNGARARPRQDCSRGVEQRWKTSKRLGVKGSQSPEIRDRRSGFPYGHPDWREWYEAQGDGQGSSLHESRQNVVTPSPASISEFSVLTVIDRLRDGGEYGERSSGAVKRLETVSQTPCPRGKEFNVPFRTGPFSGRGGWPDADGRTARFVDQKDHRLGDKMALVRSGILWSRRWEVLIRWGLRWREIRPGEGTSRREM